MKKSKHILNQEEKNILLNHFVLKKENSKKDFFGFLSRIIKDYSGEDFDLRNVPIEPNYSIELMWDEEINQTARMYCVSHPKYSHSNTKQKHFALFNGALSYKDNLGNTGLMYLAKNPNNGFVMLGVISGTEGDSEFDYHFNDFNNDGDNVVSMALKSLAESITPSSNNTKNSILKSYSAEMEVFSKIDRLSILSREWFSKNEGCPKQKNTEVFQIIEESIDGLKKMCSRLEKAELSKYDFKIIYQEINNIEKILMANKLKDELSINSSTNRKMKI